MNIYRGIPHFENYGKTPPGDALSAYARWALHNYGAGIGGYPTRERVMEISQAQDRLGQNPVVARTLRTQGQGAGIEDYGDLLRRLLRERILGGA